MNIWDNMTIETEDNVVALNRVAVSRRNLGI